MFGVAFSVDNIFLGVFVCRTGFLVWVYVSFHFLQHCKFGEFGNPIGFYILKTLIQTSTLKTIKK